MPREREKVGTVCIPFTRQDAGSSTGAATGQTRDASAAANDAAFYDSAQADDRPPSSGKGDDGGPDAASRASSECTPAKEVCDGIDNDCDGVADNDVKNECGGCAPIEPSHAKGTACSNGGEGLCARPGEYVCLGDTTICNAPDPTPSAEVCDGKDNDCDGVADNGIVKNVCGGCAILSLTKGAPCDNGLLGACGAAGTYACTTTEVIACNAPAKTGSAETCDGKDNDCNGTVDDNAQGAATWYRDCDGDGFAAKDSSPVVSCSVPALVGTCKAWTDVAPLGVANIDCDDSSQSYKPGADYGLPSSTNPSNDLNCDASIETSTTLKTPDDQVLTVCLYPQSCECYFPLARNGVPLMEWGSWFSTGNTVLHPTITCSASSADVLAVVHRTTAAGPGPADQYGCRAEGTMSGNVFTATSRPANQLCR